MQQKTIARITDAILHGEDPGSWDGLDRWIVQTEEQCLFGEAAGAVVGISIMRESIAWMVIGISSPIAEGTRDAPVLPLSGPGASLDQLHAYLIEVLREVADALEGRRLGVLGVAWVGPIGPMGEARDYPVHHSELGDERNPPLPGIMRDALVGAGLCDPAEAAVGFPDVVVINDADADLLYEARRGKARGVPNAMGVKVAGGIGLSIMHNHQLVRGARGSAGEIEHVKVRVGEDDELQRRVGNKLLSLQDLPDCACTGSECVGRFASGAAIVAQLRGYVSDKEMTPTACGRLIEEGPEHGVVTAVCGRAGELLGEALVVPAMALDPERIVISAFPRSRHLTAAVGTRLTQGTTLRLGLDNVVDGTVGLETTAAGAAQWAVEARVIPAIEADLRGRSLFRHDVPAWMRLQVRGDEKQPVFVPPVG